MYNQRTVQNTHQTRVYRSQIGTVSQDTNYRKITTSYGSSAGSDHIGNTRIDYLQTKNPFWSRTTVESTHKDYLEPKLSTYELESASKPHSFG